MKRRDKDVDNQELQIQFDNLNEKFDALQSTLLLGINNLETKIENGYVSQTEFRPIRMLVYGAVGLMCTSVFGAMVALVIVKAGGS